MYKYYCAKARKGYEVENCDFEYYLRRYNGRVGEIQKYENDWVKDKVYCPVCRMNIKEHGESIIYADLGDDD